MPRHFRKYLGVMIMPRKIVNLYFSNRFGIGSLLGWIRVDYVRLGIRLGWFRFRLRFKFRFRLGHLRLG
jgi:hypothetical protein